MMKIRRLKKAAGSENRSGGSALVITLCFLFIISALILALFNISRNDLVSSRVFATGLSASLLADTAANIVEGQVTAASTQPLVSWASQPGMVHSYNTNGVNTAYKLYSSSNMVVSGWGSSTMTAETTAMESWKTATDPSSYNAMWCDLNAPAVVSRTSPTNTAITVATPIFPIVDPGAIFSSGAGVLGFGFATNVAGTSYPASATDPARRLPMPVQWIYVLKNGQLTAPSSMSGSLGTNTVATFTGSVVPTSTNPIIGRIAFWADDDTCKLNINTASEGTYWDIPRAALPQEYLLAYTVPIVGEFQAISGHPATTSLDPVLGDLLPRPTFNFTNSTANSSGVVTVTGASSYTNLQAYYAMNPRVSDTAETFNYLNPSSGTTTALTSQGGTTNTMQSAANNAADFAPTVVYKSDRLYATPDELLFNPNRGLNPNWSDNATNNSTSLSAATLAQRDFFITAQSRAPETTLFGTPRISMWPIQQIVNSSQVCQSARDKLIHFCATVGGTNYDFQRGQVAQYNGTNQSNPSCESITNDWNIVRNQSLFNYATNMMATPEPGFGPSLATKWGTSCGTVREMTLAMDMIRSGLSRIGTTTNSAYWSYCDQIPISGGTLGGGVMPLQVTEGTNKFNGIGRQWRVASAALHIIPTSRAWNTSSPSYPGNDGWYATNAQPPTTGIQAMLLVNFYNPMPTPQAVTPSFRISITNLNNALGISVPISAGTNGPNYAIGSGTILHDKIAGGGVNYFGFLRNYGFPGFGGILYAANPPTGWPVTNTAGTYRTLTPGGTGNEASDEINNYPWLTQAVTCNTNYPTFTINPGTIQVQLMEYGSTYANAHVVQTANLYFPGWTGPLPQCVALSNNSGPQTAVESTNLPTFAGPFGNIPLRGTPNSAGSSSSSWFLPGDIVREVQLDPNGPTKGDYRLLATASVMPTNWFAANTNYAGNFNAFTTWTNSGTISTTAAVQSSLSSMTNRFAFAFQSTVGSQTYGIANGYDGGLNNNPRADAVACTGVINLGTNYGNNTWNYGQNYAVNPGGLVSNLKLFPDPSLASGLQVASIQNTPPIVPPAAPALASTPPTTWTATGWAPTNSVGAGDWASGIAWDGDGGIFSAPDTAAWFTVGSGTGEPSFFVGQSDWCSAQQEAVSEPNRVVPSPIGIFGGLPTPKAGSTISGDGLGDDLQPWQSLLLCPNPAAGSSHPGFGQGGTGSGPTALPPFTTPPDHLFIDMFWMPTVEPYAISDPLSTAGKVNLNYQMEPFTHITRRTALLGVLTPVEIAAITNSVSYEYKQPNQTIGTVFGSSFPNPQTRFPLNLETNSAPGGTPPTLFSGGTSATGCFTDFENRFSNGDVFRSASEACMLRLVPYGQTMSTTYNTWWNNNALTGLNMRESPYNQIYSRVTTKSNTYTVHYWVQALQQVTTPGRNYAQWNEATDVKTGEYRGNTTIERYLDPHATGLPDYANVNFSNYTNIDNYYTWRVVLQKQFAPGSN